MSDDTISRDVVPHEVELKYRVSDVEGVKTFLDGAWASALPDVVIGEASIRLVEDRYFDTARGALRRHGFGARLRRRGAMVTLTVKSLAADDEVGSSPDAAAPADALHRRIELEGPANARLEPDGWPSSPARELIDELRGGARLRALFTIRQRRSVRDIRAGDGAAQLSLDEVEVFVGRTVVGTFSELEIEATEGGAPLLRRLGAVLEASSLVTPASGSKEQQARQLMEQEQAADRVRRLPRVPKSPGVTADDPLSEAGRKVLGMHLARMLAAEAGTRSGEDIEQLHKMRVATRRMRSVWRVFDGAYRPRVQRYVRDLRAVATALGSVRDLDVLIEGLDAYVAGLSEPVTGAMAPLRYELAEQRESARASLIGLLDSRRYQDFVSDYLEFVETPGAGELRPEPGLPVLVRHTAGGRIWTAYEHLRAHETVLGWADVQALHAIRIDAKRLRYTLESFREVLPPAVDGVIARIVTIQDYLGVLNDADVAATMARAFLMSSGARSAPATRDAVSLYLSSREQTVATLRRGLPAAWRPIVALPTRRAIAGLIAAI
jgi:CHAD domain-containing protein